METAADVVSGQVIRDFYLEGVTMAGYTSVFAKRVADNCGGLTGESDSGKPVAFDPITIATLITTILPALTKWFQDCRERRQQKQQDQTPQQQLAAAHADQKTREKNVALLQQKILQECKRGRQSEKQRARQTGLPADLGRFAIDYASAGRLADKIHAQAATMKTADADRLCAEIGLS